MSRLLGGHYWSRLDWWSYHAEAGVHPHKMRNSNGCGLQEGWGVGVRGRWGERRRKWDVTARTLMMHGRSEWKNNTQAK